MHTGGMYEAPLVSCVRSKTLLSRRSESQAPLIRLIRSLGLLILGSISNAFLAEVKDLNPPSSESIGPRSF